LKTILSAIYLVVLCFISWLTHLSQWKLILLIGALQVASSYLIFFRSMVTGYQLFRADAWLSVTDKAITILVCASLIYLPFAPGITLEQFLWIQLGATVLAVIMSAFIAARHHEAPARQTPIADLFRLSAPFVLLILLMGIHTRLDAFLLDRMHPQGALQAGIYAAAYRLLDAANTVGYMTAAFLVPFAARHLNDPALIDKTVLRLRHALFVAAAGFVGLCAAFYPLIIQVLYHTNDPYLGKVLIACVAVLPAYYGIHLYGSLLNAGGRFRYFGYAVLGSVLLNTVLNLYWIPREAALGCCYAAIASQYVCAIVLFLGARQRFSLRLHATSLIGCLLLGLMVFAAGSLWNGYSFKPLFWWLLAAIGGSLFMFVLLYKLRPKRS
jgi:O-antigen/teichoic acid export membrane protein